MNTREKKLLIQKALHARHRAYAPYSRFKVGAALAVAGGRRMFAGANIENASYGLTVCAERTALAAAVIAGYRRFAAIAVAASGPGLTFPCGACLQALAEFCDPDFMVILVRAPQPTRSEEFRLRDLLPRAFRL